MEMDGPRTGRSARWGAACAPCAAAKSRCIRTQPSESRQCDRCRSLEKECLDQTPVPRKKRRPKPSANLDKKLPPSKDRLKNQTRSSNTSGGESSTVHGSPCSSSPNYLTNNYSASSVSTEPQVQDIASQEETAPETTAQDSASSASRRPICTCMVTVEMEDLVPVDSVETLLSIYRNQLSKLIPFVIIPAGGTLSQLETTRPFLLKVIKMVASIRHLRLVRGQHRAVMEHISNAIFVRSERSLDLLQGILVFLGFYHYHCMVHGQFNNLIHQAVGLIEDMDLNTCPASRQRKSQLPMVRAEEPVSRTNEEKRVLLGVWYMSSSAGLVVKQLAFPRYTKYLDHCLKDLDDAGEYETDRLAVQLVHIQRLTEKIIHFYSSDLQVDEQLSSPERSTNERLTIFRDELDSLRNALPPSLKSNCMTPQMFFIVDAGNSLMQLESPDFLACHYNSACLRIYEPLLAGSHLPDADSQSLASLSLSGVLITDVFAQFTAALKAWLDSWLAIPVCSYFHMPQPAYVQLVHGAMMLSRWVRVAGAGAVKLSSAGTAASQEKPTTPWKPVPALSGVPSCPDLSLPRPPASASDYVVSAQILNSLRANVAAQPNLQLDVFGILDTMAARFGAAKMEMAAAQGLEWENETWDVAAEHLKLKKARVEQWCELVARAASEERSPLTDAHNSVDEGSTDAMNFSAGQSVDDFEWLTSGYVQDNMQWESAMFDEIMRDINTGVVF